ncbi:MAG: hypothetical protein ABJA98_08340 [Acidobacteriota bacterium]
MATFQLKDGADTYRFDTSGNGAVAKNGAAFGTWTTDTRNTLTAQSADGTRSVAFDVSWVFSDRNELCIKSGATLLCNFHDDRRPRYDVVNAVLKVKPELTAPHQFELRGEWDLLPDMRLTFTTPDRVVSTLDGRVNDLRSRFNYRFASQVAGHESHAAQLVFVGRWRKDPGDPVRLNFIFQREDLSEDIFVLAGALTFSKAENQMIYRFDAGAQKHEIDFIGTLRVSPDFQISYTVANQVAQGNQTQVFASEVVIDAVFANPSFEGDLSLAVKRPGGGETIFTIGGQFKHIRVPGGTNLAIGFAVSGGTGATPTTVAIDGTFSFASGNQLQFTLARNARQTTIGVSADQIKLGSVATANAVGTIRLQDGSLRSVEVMFGITFQLKAAAAHG